MLTTEQLVQFITLAVAVVGPIASYISATRANESRLTKVEFMATETWQLLVRRGLIEAAQKGLGDIHNPFVLKPEVNAYFDKIRPELEAYYDAHQKELTSLEKIISAVMSHFGTRLAKEVCMVYDIPYDSCVLIASAIARGTDEIEFPGDLTNGEEAES